MRPREHPTRQTQRDECVRPRLPGTHYAGFESYNQRAVFEAPVLTVCCSAANGDNFGVSCWVTVGFAFVVPARNNFTVGRKYERTNRNIFTRISSFGNCLAHEFFVVHECTRLVGETVEAIACVAETGNDVSVFVKFFVERT